MLILTRKSGESIVVGDKIRVTVIEIKGNQVRLGVEAPRQTSVHREEVYRKIQASNILAADSSATDLSKFREIWSNSRNED